MIVCKDWIGKVGVVELKLTRRFYSYNGSTYDQSRALSRINNAFRSIAWMQKFGGISVHYMELGLSDQSSLLIRLASREKNRSPFRILIYVMEHDQFLEKVT